MRYLNLSSLFVLLFTTLFALEAPYTSGPGISHANLTIYPIFSKAEPQLDTTAMICLAEALESKAITIVETGSVNELALEVHGNALVYLQAGDVVKGGKQDRVIGYDMLVSRKDGKVSLSAFCVEQGRWQQRGQETVANFASSSHCVSGNAIKSAIRDAPMGMPGVQQRQGVQRGQQQQNLLEQEQGQIIQIETQYLLNVPQEALQTLAQAGLNPTSEIQSRSNGQSAVWEEVSKAQIMVCNNSALKMEDLDSQSSLQLMMEHEKILGAIKDYEDALCQALTDNNIVGFAFSINGVMNGAEIYASHDLFSKMWPKLLRSSATEALGLKDAKTVAEESTVDTTQHLDLWINRHSEFSQKTTTVVPGCDNRICTKGTERCYDTNRLDDSGGTLLHRALLK